MELTEADFPPVETADIASTHREVRVTPTGRAELAFRLALADGWTEDPQAVGDPGDGSAWTALAAFGRKPDSAPAAEWAMISVLWRKLEVEVPLDEWTAFQMAAFNAEIATLRLWKDAAGTVIDVGGTVAGTVDLASGNTAISTVMRAMLRADGQDLLMVWSMSSQGSYQAVSRDLVVAGASFRLERPAQGGRERVLKASGDNPSFEVSFPASWIYQPVPAPEAMEGKSALNLVLVEDELLKGLIRVKALDIRVVKVHSLEALVNDATEELAEAGAIPQRHWEPMSDPVILSIADLEAAFVSSVSLQEHRYEVHFAIVQRPPILFCVTALVMPPELEAIICMRGHRAYAIALETAIPR